MGPALETFLTLFLPVLIVLAILGALTRPFWKRCYRFFVRWYEGDLRAEEERKREEKQRILAEKELRQFCHDDDSTAEEVTTAEAATKQADGAAAQPEAGIIQRRPEIQTQREMPVRQEAPQTAQAEVHIGGHTTETQDAS